MTYARYAWLSLLLTAGMLLGGCATDRDVSYETHQLASGLTFIAEDLQRDAVIYLQHFEDETSARLDAAERETLRQLGVAGKLTPEAQSEVADVFNLRRARLKANVETAKDQYRARSRYIALAAQMVLEGDKYWNKRVYGPWEALGGGLAEGALSKAWSLTSLMKGIKADPLPVEGIK